MVGDRFGTGLIIWVLVATAGCASNEPVDRAVDWPDNFQGEFSILDGRWDVQGFRVEGSARQVSYTVKGDADDYLGVAVLEVEDASAPDIHLSESWHADFGSSFAKDIRLEPGDYGLFIECDNWAYGQPTGECDVTYTIRLGAELPPLPPPPAVDCSSTPNVGNGPRSLPEWQPAQTPPPGRSYYVVDSPEGWTGYGGPTEMITSDSVDINIYATDRGVAWSIDGDDFDRGGGFDMRQGCPKVRVGLYAAVSPFESYDRPNFAILDTGVALAHCSTRSHAVAIDEMSSTVVTLRFAQTCDGLTRLGKVHWEKDAPPLQCPVAPLVTGGDPGRLPSWQPLQAAPSGSTFVIEGEEGSVFEGDYLYVDEADATFRVAANEGHLTVAVDGDESWDVAIDLPPSCTRFVEGVFENLSEVQTGPTQTRLWLSGEAVGCGVTGGAIAIDEADYDPTGQLIHIVLRFQHHCHDRTAATMAKLVWHAS